MTGDPRQIFTPDRVRELARLAGLIPPQGRAWSRKQEGHTRPAIGTVDREWMRDRLCFAWQRLQDARTAPRQATKGRPRNEAARQFLGDLAAIYSSVGLQWTPATIGRGEPGQPAEGGEPAVPATGAPFYVFAAECFKLADLPTGSLRRWIEERGQDRARWMRELPSETFIGPGVPAEVRQDQVTIVVDIGKGKTGVRSVTTSLFDPDENKKI